MNSPTLTSAAQQAQPGALSLQTPAISSLSEAPSVQVNFEDDEFNTSQVVRQEYVINVNVPRILKMRKLYAAVWTQGTSGIENWVKTRVKFWLNNTVVGSVPLSVGVTTSGTATTLNRILPSSINGGGYPQYDDMTLTLDNPQAWSAVNAFLHPLVLKADIDRITVSVEDFFQTSNLKIYFACLSYGE